VWSATGAARSRAWRGRRGRGWPAGASREAKGRRGGSRSWALGVAPGCPARSGLGRSAGALAAHLGERNEGEEREERGGDWLGRGNQGVARLLRVRGARLLGLLGQTAARVSLGFFFFFLFLPNFKNLFFK
jgi:hypothetical protein